MSGAANQSNALTGVHGNVLRPPIQGDRIFSLGSLAVVRRRQETRPELSESGQRIFDVVARHYKGSAANLNAKVTLFPRPENGQDDGFTRIVTFAIRSYDPSQANIHDHPIAMTFNVSTFPGPDLLLAGVTLGDEMDTTGNFSWLAYRNAITSLFHRGHSQNILDRYRDKPGGIPLAKYRIGQPMTRDGAMEHAKDVNGMIADHDWAPALQSLADLALDPTIVNSRKGLTLVIENGVAREPDLGSF